MPNDQQDLLDEYAPEPQTAGTPLVPEGAAADEIEIEGAKYGIGNSVGFHVGPEFQAILWKLNVILRRILTGRSIEKRAAILQIQAPKLVFYDVLFLLVL